MEEDIAAEKVEGFGERFPEPGRPSVLPYGTPIMPFSSQPLEQLKFLGYLRRILDIGGRTFGDIQSPYGGFGTSDG